MLEANRDHWNAERGPRLERVVFHNDLTQLEALERCLAGELDIVSEVQPPQAARVEASEHARLVSFDANRVLVGIFNRAAEDVPLGDARARRALTLAVDRERLVREGFAGHATPLAGLSPPWVAAFPPGLEPRPFEPVEAKRLLGEAGWPVGRSLRLATPPDLEPAARMVAGELTAALGIGVEVLAVPADEVAAGARLLAEKRIVPPWDVLMHVWADLSSDVPPAAVHREFLGADGAFRAGPEVPEFDALFAELKGTVDPKRMTEVARRIDRLCFDEALVLSLCLPKALYAVNRHVRFSPYRTTLELADTEVDDEHRSLAGPPRT